jgi:hypothetical protein
MEKLLMALPCLAVPAMLLVMAAFVAIVVFVILGSRKREEAYTRQAATWGFHYYADDPWNLPERYEDAFDFFRQGSSRSASHILAGRMDGFEVLGFEYEYTTGSGKDETTWNYSVAVFELPILAPHLQLRDESFLDKMAAWVGHDDINFESDEFSRRYHVKCDQPKFAQDFFHPRLIEYLLACGHCPGMETRGTLLVLYDPEQTGVERIVRLVDIGRQMIRSIPDYVRHERPAGTGGAAHA